MPAAVRIHVAEASGAEAEAVAGDDGWPLVFGLVLVGAERVRHALLPAAQGRAGPGSPARLAPSVRIPRTERRRAWRSLIFLFLWLYPLRKKFRWLAFTGSISKWLDVHALAALGLPLLVAAHATWQFGGVIGLGFWSMMVVWLSGIVGRYLYARIPRSQAGVELTIEEIAAQRQALLEEIATAVRSRRHGDRGGARGRSRTDRRAWTVADAAPDGRRRPCAAGAPRPHSAARSACVARCSAAVTRQALKEVLRLANREMALVQQSRMLGATQNILRFWHVAHRPLAITALVAVVIHVVVVVSLGATWFR